MQWEHYLVLARRKKKLTACHPCDYPVSLRHLNVAESVTSDGGDSACNKTNLLSSHFALSIHSDSFRKKKKVALINADCKQETVDDTGCNYVYLGENRKGGIKKV